MYKKVLVPLDSSELAECALPHVSNLAKDGSVGEVTILNVIWADFLNVGGAEATIGIDVNAMKGKLLLDVKKYLADVQSRFDAEGIKVKTELLESNRPAAAISDYARKNDMDLIVIATHGYTGLKKLMFGSVAMEVLHNSHAAVLLIRPESCRI